MDSYIDNFQLWTNLSDNLSCQSLHKHKKSNTKKYIIQTKKLQQILFIKKNNQKYGATELRSRRLMHAKHTLYQMSYYPISTEQCQQAIY
ncbi:hypothetical protein pb186bvf_004651 [Paramecium bursaria]